MDEIHGLAAGSGLAVDDQQPCDLLISLGESERRAGNPEFRETLLAAADHPGSQVDPVPHNQRTDALRRVERKAVAADSGHQGIDHALHRNGREGGVEGLWPYVETKTILLDAVRGRSDIRLLVGRKATAVESGAERATVTVEPSGTGSTSAPATSSPTPTGC